MLDVDELISAWDKRFSEYSYNNKIYGRLCLHTIVGQTLRHLKIIKHGIEIDSRLSFFLVQSSGSGKSTALGFVINVADEIGLSFESITNWSDAALVGTIESKEERKGKTSETVYNKVTGILDDADILHIDEASLLFSPTKYNQSTLSMLQLALNPIGSPSNKIKKKLAHGEAIEIQPHLSLFLTSYNPDDVTDLVAKRGIMQRMAIYARFLDPEERLENLFKDIDYLGVESLDKDHLEEEIVESLRSISHHFEKVKKIEFDPSIKPLLRNLAQRLYKTTQNVNPYIIEQVNAFLPRYLTYIYVISGHHAAIRLSSKVEAEDVKYAYQLVKILFSSVVSWLESEMQYEAKKKSYDKDSAIKAAISIFDQFSIDGKMSLPKWIRLVSEKTERSTSTIYRYMKDQSLLKTLIIDRDNKVVRRKE
jgi:hypothetical protein